MENLLQFLISLDEGGCLRINTDGNRIYAYFKYETIPDDLRDGIMQYRGELLHRLRRVAQDRKEKDIKAKGVLII